MKIDRVESYRYWSSRNHKTFVEITFWYDPDTLERKETRRTYNEWDDGQMPDWATTVRVHHPGKDSF